MYNQTDPATVFLATLAAFGEDIYLQRRVYRRGSGLYSLIRNEINLEDQTWDIYNENLEYDSAEGYNGRRLESEPGENPSVTENPDIQTADESYWSNKIERWTVRYTMASRKTQIPDMEMDRPEGESHSIPMIMYFPPAAIPNEGDRVYIPDKRFPNGTTLWEIRYAHPEVGLNRQPVYYLCGLARMSIEGQQLGG
jgi:hypothetical protein